MSIQSDSQLLYLSDAMLKLVVSDRAKNCKFNDVSTGIQLSNI